MASQFRRRLAVYYLICFLVLVIASIAGNYSKPAAIRPCATGAESLSEVNVLCAEQSAVRWGVRLLTVAVLTVPVNRLVRAVLGLRRDADLIAQQLTPDDNDSPAILNAGGFIAVGFLIFGIPFTTIPNFLINVAFRGALTGLLAVPLTILLVRWRCRIKTFTEYIKQIKLARTNGAAIWTAAGLVLSALIV